MYYQQSNNTIHIDNKYFTASIKVESISTLDDPQTDLPINAIIVNNSFDSLETVSKKQCFAESDVKLFISSYRPTTEQIRFCIDQQGIEK